MSEESLNTYYDELGKTLGEALLAPTRIYVKALKALKNNGIQVKGCSHITGGGFFENVPRMLPEHAHAYIHKDSYEVPAIFKLIAKNGQVEEKMMYNTFNMGIGMVLALKKEDVEKAQQLLAQTGDQSFVIGEIKQGDKGVTLC